MLSTRVIPCLLLKDAALVKGVQFKNHCYVGDPLNAVHIFNEMEVDELILLDIGATSEKRKPNFQMIEDIASECFMPLVYGGGIRELDDIRKILEIGVEKIAINSYAFEYPEFVRKAAQEFGSQSIIVSIDVKKNVQGKNEVFIFGGEKSIGVDPASYAKKIETMGAGEILLNSIDREGTWEGYDIELIKQVTSAVKIPVIACGGAGKIEDFNQAVKSGASAVAAGSMFVYQGKDRGVLINFPTKVELQGVLT